MVHIHESICFLFFEKYHPFSSITCQNILKFDIESRVPLIITREDWQATGNFIKNFSQSVIFYLYLLENKNKEEKGFIKIIK